MYCNNLSTVVFHPRKTLQLQVSHLLYNAGVFYILCDILQFKFNIINVMFVFS